jgi:hypothetical protein
MDNIDYALGTNNKNLKLSATDCTNLSGEDFTEYKLPDVGANEDLLPKNCLSVCRAEQPLIPAAEMPGRFISLLPCSTPTANLR